MKYIISLIFFTLSAFGFDYHLKSYNIVDDVDCFFGLFSTANKMNGGNIINSCYIKTNEGYVVIDSGPTYSYAQQANQAMREKNQLPVKYVINTAAEEVHILGNNFYKEQGAILLGPQEYREYENGDGLKLKKTLTKDTFQNTSIVPLDRYIESNESLYVGGLKIDIIKIIENSNRYLVVYIPEKDIIFVGDMVFNNRIPSLKNGRSIIHWLKALNKIEQMSWQRLISSHGVNTRHTAIKNTKNYLTILKDNVSKKIANGETKRSILQSTKMFSFKKNHLYNKCHKKNVSVAYNELKKKIKKKKIIKKRAVEPNIQYYKFNNAIKKATTNHKLVLMEIYSDNCPFCNKLNAIFLKNSKVKRLINQNFVMVKVNNSRDELPLGIEIGVTPSLVFIRADTKEVKMIIPGIDTLNELINTLKEGIEDGHKEGYLE